MLRVKALRVGMSAAVVAAGLLLSGAPAAQAVNLCPSGIGKAVTHISYTLNGPSGTRVVTTLRGNVRLGDNVTVNFKVPATCASEVLSIASYKAQTAPPYTLEQAATQTLFDSATGTFTPGYYSMSVNIPPDLLPSVTVPVSVDAGTTINWATNGSGNLPCPGGAHWVLSPAKGVISATVTVNGVTYVMTRSGGGSFSANSAGPIDANSTASATFQGENSNASLQLSDCPHFQVDFGQYPVQDPPQYRLTGRGLGSDAA
jgi:hypothetical protein